MKREACYFSSMTAPALDTLKCLSAQFGGGFTIWHGTAFSDCQRNEIQLRHSVYTTSQAIGQCNGGGIVAESVGVSENCYISQLNVSVGPEIVNETIECAHSNTNHVTTSIGQSIGVGSNWKVRGQGSSNSTRAKRARKIFSHAH